MTRRQPPDPIDEILAALETILGDRPSYSHKRLFREYLELFLRWNQVHRMTALDSPLGIARELFIDSLLFLEVVPKNRPLAVVDIGAGAGIPGLPMKLADPGLVLYLVESKRKRVSFLRAACRKLGLADVVVLEGRAERMVQQDPTLRESFDVAVSRSVARIGRLSSMALPFLKSGGEVVVSASPQVTADPAVELIRVHTPGTGTIRNFQVLKK